MDIYVQSRGYSHNFDYCWQPAVPSHLKNISGLIQSESPSVVIARFDKQLMLLVTGLESQEKKDIRDRPIRHSIAWVCNDNSYEERQIRAIAVKALQGLSASQVDECINFGGESGFEASLPKIQEMSESFSSAEIEQPDLPLEISCKIGKNSQDLRNSLADTLQKYSLPKEYKFLVVVTGIKSEETLENARIWRSLSNLVKSENWRELSRGRNNEQNFLRAGIAIIAVIAIAALALLILLLHPLTPKPEVIPTPTPTISPINQTIEETPQEEVIPPSTPTMSPINQTIEETSQTNKNPSSEEVIPTISPINQTMEETSQTQQRSSSNALQKDLTSSAKGLTSLEKGLTPSEN